MEIPDKIFFKIGEVSDVAGVKPYVLRYWETEFSIVPHKSSSGQRLYRRRDIERILLIKRLLYAEGYTIAGARKYLTKSGKTGSESTFEGAVSEAEPEERALNENETSIGIPRDGDEEAGLQASEVATESLDAEIESALDARFANDSAHRTVDERWVESLREEVRSLQEMIRSARTLKA